jgi:uncharacterized protein YfdQ (DUF2303 family)
MSALDPKEGIFESEAQPAYLAGLENIEQAGKLRPFDAAEKDDNARSDKLHILVPSGFNLTTIDKNLDHPLRKTGKFTFADTDSFANYFGRHERDGGESMIYANKSDWSFLAVFNDHQSGEKGEAGHRDHTARLQLKLSPDWQEWMQHNRKPLPHFDFAEFIEDHLHNIVEPEAATVLESCKTLQIKRNIDVDQAVNLDNGAVQLNYSEDVKGTTQRGSVELAQRFTLGIEPFEFGPAYRVGVRVRYRISDEKVFFVYTLDRPEKVLDDAFGESRDTIERLTKLRPLLTVTQ